MIKSHPPAELDEEVQLITLALKATGGNVGQAAKVLGMNKWTLHAKIRRSPQLHKYRRDQRKAAVERLTGPLDLPSPEKIVQQAEEGRFKADLSHIGVTPEEAELGAKLYVFQLRNSVQALAQLGGGNVRAAMQLISMIDRLSKESYPDEFDENGRLLRSGRRLADEMILRTQSEFGKLCMGHSHVALMRAKAQHILDRLNAGNAQGPSHGKPGFSPPRLQQVLVQPGATAVFNNRSTLSRAPTEETGQHQEFGKREDDSESNPGVQPRLR